MVDEDSAVVGPQLPFSYPALLPERRPGMPQPGTAAAGRWLWQRARLVVHRRSAPPGAIPTRQTPATGGFAASLCRIGRGAKWSGAACFDRGAVERRAQNARLVDRMTHPPLDNPDRIALFHRRARAAAT